GHDAVVRALTPTADGKALASVGQDRKARLWDLATGRPSATLGPADGRGAPLAVAPDGRTAAVLAQGGVKLWDLAAGKERAALAGRVSAPFPPAAFAPDGKALAVAAGKAVTVWDAASGRERFTRTGHADQV